MIVGNCFVEWFENIQGILENGLVVRRVEPPPHQRGASVLGHTPYEVQGVSTCGAGKERQRVIALA